MRMNLAIALRARSRLSQIPPRPTLVRLAETDNHYQWLTSTLQSRGQSSYVGQEIAVYF